MNTFIGNIEARLDGKGRVFIPATYLYERQHRQLARQSTPCRAQERKTTRKINILK